MAPEYISTTPISQTHFLNLSSGGNGTIYIPLLSTALVVAFSHVWLPDYEILFHSQPAIHNHQRLREM